jgi:lipid II:glycine glycyltransferase (peptidoglycan interpeptide bridge formation enzyme)
MTIRQIASENDLRLYGQWIASHPQGNLWQSIERMHYVHARGKKARMYACFAGDQITASALVVIDDTKGGLSTWEIPRGPIWNDETAARALIDSIVQEAKKEKALCLYLSPTLALDLHAMGFQKSPRHVHAEATRILDLMQTQEEMLAAMHQKGRYNIKVAQKNGVVVEQSRDVRSYAWLAQETSKRDGFTAVSERQYEAFLNHLPGSFLMLAYSGEKPIAGLIGVTWGKTGIYYYGASDYEHRALMAPYLLQWEAIQFCKRLGCTQYDLLGIAPEGAAKDHPWMGITDFKAKFGGTVLTYPPEQEIVLRPMTKGLLQMKRKILG